jgi:mannosyltransferase OCH1-like enzyme
VYADASQLTESALREVLTRYNKDIYKRWREELIQHNLDTLNARILSYSPPSPLQPQSIPRIIHFIWIDKSDILGRNTYPLKYDRCIRSWSVRNPEYMIEFWNGFRIWNEIILPHFPEWIDTYLSIRTNIIRCDLARYLILFIKGGIYSDMDIYCRKSIRTLLQPSDRQFLYTYEPVEHGHHILIGLFGCVPHLPIIKQWIDILRTKSLQNLDSTHVMGAAGPTAFTQFLETHAVLVDPPVSTCNMIPFTKKQQLTQGCAIDDIFTYTLWNEGSGWGLV